MPRLARPLPALFALALVVSCQDAPTVASSRAPAATVAASKGSGGGGGGGTPAPSGGSVVAGVSVTPSIVAQGTTAGYVVGGTTGTGTVTLSTVAAAATTVSLSSDNGFVMPVPATVTVPAGQRSATFPVGTIPVRGTFTLNISAGVSAITASARVYVVPTAGTDIIAIPTLTLSPKRTSPPLGEVKLQATSTNAAAVLTAYWDGSPVAALHADGGGRFSATFSLPTLDGDVEVRSPTGGCAVRATNRPTPSRSCPSL